MYLQRREKSRTYFTSRTHPRSIGCQKWKRKKIIVNPFHSRTHLHLCTQCVVCYHLTVQLDPKTPQHPLPKHTHTHL